MRSEKLLLVAALAGLACSAQPAGTLLGCTSDGTLFSINLSTGAGTQIGTLNGGCTEIVINSTGTASFFQLPDGSFEIQSFNAAAGTATGSPVGDAASFTGLQYIGGTLYGTAILTSGGPSTLRTLDPVTGNSTTIGNTGIGPISGLAYNGTLYGISGGSGTAGLYTLNLTTGAATLIGSTGIQAGGLAFGPDGNLYAGGTGPNAGNVYRINPATGASTLVGATTVDDAAGVTGLALLPPNMTPTPAPGGLLLAGLGLLLMFVYFAAARGFFRRRNGMI